MQTLEFYFSPGSRYSYLALSKVPALERRFGKQFDWIPVVGKRVRAIRGVDPFSGPPQSGQYDWEYRRIDAEAWADLYGIAFLEPQSVVVDSDLFGRGAIAAKKQDLVREYSWELASEVFGRGTWPLDEAVCIRTARSLGLDVAEFSKLLSSEEVRTEIETNCSSAVEKGVFGTPTFLVGSKRFWGNDRIPLVTHELSRLEKGGA